MMLRTRGGDFNSFFSSCIAFIASLLALWIFAHLAEPRWIENWETFLRKAAREHSPLGIMGWKAANRATIYPMFALLPVLWMTAAWCLQRVLPERVAKAFNHVHTFVIVALAIAVTSSFISLMSAPPINP